MQTKTALYLLNALLIEKNLISNAAFVSTFFINQNFARYDPHADPENPRRNPLLFHAGRFMTWLLVGTFSFFGIHTALWGVRSLIGPRLNGREPRDPEGPRG